MAFDPLTGLFGASVVGGLIDTFVGASSSSKNYKAQMEALAWQKEAQRTTWQREDTAVQRRVADLRSAGLSPVLAAGQGAQASGPIQVTAPQYHKQWSIGQALDKAGAAMALMQGKANIAYTDAQKEYIKKQMESLDLQNQLMRHDLGIILNDGLPSKTSAFGSMYRDARAFFDQTVDMFKTENTGSINVPGLEAAKKAVRENEARKRANEAREAHQNYQKEYADRQAYQAGSRHMFSR